MYNAMRLTDMTNTTCNNRDRMKLCVDCAKRLTYMMNTPKVLGPNTTDRHDQHDTSVGTEYD